MTQKTTEARQTFIRGTGTLMEAVRRGEAEDFAVRADLVGVEGLAVFRFVRERLGEVFVPATCSQCHESFIVWLDLLIAAADTMVQASKANDPPRLREIQGLFAEGRIYSIRFRTQYEALVNQIRELTSARNEQRKRRSRFLPGAGAPGE